MFEPKENPGYDKLSHDAASLIAQWSRNDWYEGSSAEEDKVEDDDQAPKLDNVEAERVKDVDADTNTGQTHTEKTDAVEQTTQAQASS